MKTREALGVFFEGEETDGFLVYGYWQTSSPIHHEVLLQFKRLL